MSFFTVLITELHLVKICISNEMYIAAAGFFFFRKKNSGLRLCIDYHGLNSIMKPYPYPLPLVSVALVQGSRKGMNGKEDERKRMAHTHCSKGASKTSEIC